MMLCMCLNFVLSLIWNFELSFFDLKITLSILILFPVGIVVKKFEIFFFILDIILSPLLPPYSKIKVKISVLASTVLISSVSSLSFRILCCHSLSLFMMLSTTFCGYWLYVQNAFWRYLMSFQQDFQ